MSSAKQAHSPVALPASEATYRTLFESMNGGCCLVEILRDERGEPVDLLFLEANPAHAQHTGLHGVVGKKASEVVPGFDSELPAYLRDVYVPVLRTGVPGHVELYAKALERWLEHRIVRVGDAAQNRLAVLLTDVTLRRQAAEELRRNAERSAFMVRLADALASLADPVEIQDAATRIIGEHLGADRVHYAEINGDEVIVRREYLSKQTPSIAGVHRLGHYPASSSELALGRTLVCEDIRVDARLDATERAALSRLGLRALASVPLVRKGALRALLCAQHVLPHSWTLDEVELIEETGERTWAATERAHAESALRETEERFRTIAQNVHDHAIFLTNARGTVTAWPNGAVRMLGYSAEEAVGQPASMFYCERDVAAGQYARELADAARDGHAEREGWRVRKDGQRLWVNEIWTAVRDGAGNVVGFTKISRNLTEKRREEEALRESEERFRHALEIETVGVVFFDGSGAITHANDAFYRMTGYSREDTRDRTLALSALTAPEARGARGRAFEVLEATGSMPACEQRCVRKDGGSFWGLLAAKRLSASERVEFILDITERKRAEEGLAAAHADLEERVARRTAELAQTNQALADEVAQRRRAEEVRSDLLRRLDSAQEDERRRVARDLHDQVGQTLTALTLAVRATREAGPLPVEVCARLADVQRAAEELGREVHGLAVRLRPTALDDLGLHAALGQLLSEWSARTHVEVDCHLADLEQARLPPDFETMLYRVVQEALTNVARHSHATRASVVVQRLRGAVLAIVEDDGVGFDPQAVSSGRVGLLGLTERVALAGGGLEIESAHGKGTTVIARIPC